MPQAAEKSLDEAPLREPVKVPGVQYLTFSLAGEKYGVEILRVQEIRGWEPVTRVPNAPSYVKGVLNLRGAIVPVLDLRGTIVPIIDLRSRFQLSQAEYTPTTVIIVMAVESDSGGQVMGMVVDAVCDVLDLVPSEIKQAPNLGVGINSRYIEGMVSRDRRMVVLLDAAELLNARERELPSGPAFLNRGGRCHEQTGK